MSYVNNDSKRVGYRGLFSNKKNVIGILTGTFLMAVAYKAIYDSLGMVTGGFSGIAIIIRNLIGIPIWITNIVLNLPLMAAVYMLSGKKAFARTLFGTVSLTFFMALMPTAHISDGDFLLAAVFGGVFAGAGVGLVLRNLGNTGGTDTLAVLICRFIRGYSIVSIIQIMDFVIIVAGLLVFGLNSSLYSIIAVYITSIVSDRVISGPNRAKNVLVITDKYEQISEYIMQNVKRGVTYLVGIGGYTGKEKRIIMCVVSVKQLVVVREAIAAIDENAFLIIGDVNEVFGEGFQQYL